MGGSFRNRLRSGEFLLPPLAELDVEYQRPTLSVSFRLRHPAFLPLVDLILRGPLSAARGGSRSSAGPGSVPGMRSMGVPWMTFG